MSKVVIVGVSGAGKTCYFYGMLRTMMRGINGFSLRINNPEEYCRLRTGMKRLGDTSLPLAERWPNPSHVIERFDLDLLHNMGVINNLEWVDYPGEIAANATGDFINLLDGANCLIICVDGSQLRGTPDEIGDLAYDFFNNYGGMELCNALGQAALKNNGSLPPVCVVISKYDMVSEELRTKDCLDEFLKESFPVLFTKGNGQNRMVTYVPVTLGKEIASGGPLRPVNVEKPICFATYLVQVALTQQLKDELLGKVEANKKSVEEYNKMRFWRQLIKVKPEPITQEQLDVITKVIEAADSDLEDLRGRIEGMPLYINGEEISWP